MTRFPRQGEPATRDVQRADWARRFPVAHEPPAAGGAWPAVSIVTPSLNQAAYIADAIASVAGQGYPGLEHLVIDGGSGDGTLEVLRAHASSVRWTSEPDSGQANAVNKGLARARGEVVGWLNADDFYQPDAVRAAVSLLAAHPEVDVVYGDCIYLYQDVEPEESRLVRARPFDLPFLLDVGCFVPQPATFFRRAALAGITLDEDLRFAMDYDLWIRLAKAGRAFAYLPRTLATFRITASSKSGARLDEFWREVRLVSRRNGGRILSPMLWEHLKGIAARRWPRGWTALKQIAGRGRGAT